MPHAPSIAIHMAIGSVAVLLYWGALLAVKGSPWHRAWGKGFFIALMVVVASVGPVLLLKPYEPALLIQFIYLTLCAGTVAMLGWTAIRWKGDVERFRGTHFKVMGAAIFLLGLVVLGAGIATGRALTAVFSWVGLVYGGAMLCFAWMRAEPHPRWWLAWHLNAVAGLFNAVHGTVLAVIWRALVDPAAGDELLLVTQLGTTAASLGIRLWFGSTRGIPWRFSRPPQAASSSSSLPARSSA
ncbi:MAG TPA: hypothetical protein VG900_15900 [Hyphomicrobiaceae bacterium]|jgi:hypothetical protein|nr:hypothetical protein [Hyphomicrobiaceae bacterium]